MSEFHRDRELLDRLRDGYEARGYQFIMLPDANLLPPALRSHRPDALALRGPEKLIIEVKRTRSPSSEKRLAELSREVSRIGSGWDLVVVYANEVGSGETLLPRVDRDLLAKAMSEARELSREGHQAAALVIGWGILEAVARDTTSGESAGGAVRLGPARIVDTLEQNGTIGWEDAKRLRSLAELRNAVVHGDFTRSVEAEHVRTLIECIEPLVGPPFPEAA